MRKKEDTCCSLLFLPADGRQCQEIDGLLCYTSLVHFTCWLYCFMWHYLLSFSLFKITNPLKCCPTTSVKANTVQSPVYFKDIVPNNGWGPWFSPISQTDYLFAKKMVETLSDVVNHKLGRTESTGNFWKCENDESKISQEVTEKPFEF